MPVGALLVAASPLVAKIGAAGGGAVGKKGAGIAVRAISNIKTKAQNILSKKRDRAQLKADEARARAAQIAALAGGTTFSNRLPESAAEKVTFGDKPKGGLFNLQSKKQGETMEKAKEFFSKNWMYVVGGLVLLMVLRKKR